MSRAQRRWASVAISLATSTFESEIGPLLRNLDPTKLRHTLGPDLSTVRSYGVLAVDEPESALHPEAIHRLAHTLVGPGRSTTIVATHSPVLIAAADRTLHLQRTSDTVTLDDGRGLLQPVLELPGRSDTGLLPADFLTLTRLLVLTEGSHDALVLRTLMADSLARARALLARCNGSTQMPPILRNMITFRALTCPVLLVLDDFHDEDRTWWNELTDPQVSDPRERIEEIRRRASHRGDRWDTFRQIADVAYENQALHRIQVDGFPAIDIPLLLPPSSFGVDSWHHVTEAVEARDGKLTSAGIKRWMFDNSTPIDRRSVARAVLDVDRGVAQLSESAEHSLALVADAIERLGSSPDALLETLTL